MQQVQLAPVLDGPTILNIQQIIRRVPAADHVIQYAMRLVRSTRVHEAIAGSGYGNGGAKAGARTSGDEPDVEIPQIVREYVSWGAGPRACQYLILGGKVRAVLHGRYHVSTDDIQTVAKPVLRHRIVTNFNADAEGYTTDKIVDRLIELIPARQSAIAANPRTAKAIE